MSDENKPEEKQLEGQKDKVIVTEDGKATPTEESARKAAENQQADPDVQTTSEPTDSPASELKPSASEDDAAEAEKAEKAKKAAEARAERAAARAKKLEEDAAPKEPSPNQPKLDKLVALIKSKVSEGAVEEAYVNEADQHLPYVIIRKEHWKATAELLKTKQQMNYLRNLSGVDMETHFEVVYHLSKRKQRAASRRMR
jgi:NADH-quinone oxidoreductase subunit C